MDLREKRLLAALAASERTRRVLLFLQTYSVLLCIVCLNMTSWGYKERRALVQDARDLYTCETPPSLVRNVLAAPASKAPPPGNSAPVAGHGAQNDPAPTVVGPGQNASAPHFLARSKDPANDAQIWSNACADNVGLSRERATAVAEWVLVRRLSSRDVDLEMGRVEADMRTNVYNVPIPLTGMHIDVNSFSLVGAAGHMLLLVWLLLSIYQEQHNLQRIDAASVEIVVRHMLFFAADGDRRKPAFHLIRLSAASAILAPLVPLYVMALDDWSKLSQYRSWFPSLEGMVLTEFSLVLLGTAVAGWCVKVLWGTVNIVASKKDEPEVGSRESATSCDASAFGSALSAPPHVSHARSDL